MFFLFNDTATTEIYTYGHTLSRHDALPISAVDHGRFDPEARAQRIDQPAARPERRLRRDDMVADGKLTQQRRGHRRHAARLYPARLGALDQRDPFLEHLDGRVLEPRIGHADLVDRKSTRLNSSH